MHQLQRYPWLPVGKSETQYRRHSANDAEYMVRVELCKDIESTCREAECVVSLASLRCPTRRSTRVPRGLVKQVNILCTAPVKQHGHRNAVGVQSVTEVVPSRVKVAAALARRPPDDWSDGESLPPVACLHSARWAHLHISARSSQDWCEETCWCTSIFQPSSVIFTDFCTS